MYLVSDRGCPRVCEYFGQGFCRYVRSLMVGICMVLRILAVTCYNYGWEEYGIFVKFSC